MGNLSHQMRKKEIIVTNNSKENSDAKKIKNHIS